MPASQNHFYIKNDREYVDLDYARRCSAESLAKKNQHKKESLEKRLDRGGFPASREKRDLALSKEFLTKHPLYIPASQALSDQKWALLHGVAGTGKTTLAMALAVAYAKKYPLAKTLFLKIPLWLSSLRPGGETTIQNTLESLGRASLVVLDDLGSESPSEWVREQLYLLIDHLESNLESYRVAITCNTSALQSRPWGERINDRVCGNSVFIEFSNPSYRISK